VRASECVGDDASDIETVTAEPPVLPGGTLYVVATPIGNLEDITYRAVRVLRGVDRVLCEDTRTTRTLCERFGVTAPLLRHDAHTEARSTEGALALLAAGERLALVSDAGTPGVSDPGGRLVRAAARAGFGVVPIPGPSAVIAAISVSGLGDAGFTFGGFLPKPGPALGAALAGLGAGVHVFFVPARDLEATVETAPVSAEIVACRELTKQHERVYRGGREAVLAALRDDPHAGRGEAVVIFGVRAAEVDDASIASALRAHLAAGARRKAAIGAVAESLGVRRGRVYALALSLDPGE